MKLRHFHGYHHGMPGLHAIPRSAQRNEPWANGAGSTTVILREPDSADWRLRISVAKVDHDGPFSNLPDTRRLLVPLDAPMALQFADGHTLHGPRMQAMCFDGAPAPVGMLPEGPTRDFNLMLRGDSAGEVLPRTLVDSMMLTVRPGLRWALYLDSGRALVHVDGGESLELAPHDAVLTTTTTDGCGRVRLEGAGEIVLVKLYA